MIVHLDVQMAFIDLSMKSPISASAIINSSTMHTIIYILFDIILISIKHTNFSECDLGLISDLWIEIGKSGTNLIQILSEKNEKYQNQKYCRRSNSILGHALSSFVTKNLTNLS